MKRLPLRRTAATFLPGVEIVEDRTAPSANPLFGAASSLLALPDPSALLKTAVAPIQASSQVLPAVPSIINSVVNTVPTTLPGLASTTSSTPGPNLLAAVTNVVTGVVATAEKTVGGTVGGLLSTVTNTVGVPNLLPAVTNAVSDLLATTDKALTGTTSDLLAAVTNIVPVLAPVTTAVDSLVTNVVNLPTNVVNDVTGSVSAPSGNTGSGLGGLLGSITAPVVTVVDTLVTSATNVVGNTIGGDSGQGGVVVAPVTGPAGTIVGTVETQLPIVTTETASTNPAGAFAAAAQGASSATTEPSFVAGEEATPVLVPTRLAVDPAPAFVSLVGAAFTKDLDAPAAPTGTDVATTSAATVTGTGDDLAPVSLAVPVSNSDVTANTEAAGFVSSFAPIDPEALAQALGQFAGQLDSLRGGVSDWLGDHSALMPWLAVMASSAVGLELYRRRAQLQAADIPGV